MPTFSVITPNFNSGRKLWETAKSVCEQDEDAEYIIIDGASTDDSLSIAREMEKASLGRIQLSSEPDRGIYEAMNKGIDRARGRYLFFIGAGDRLMPGVLAEVKRLLPAHEQGFLYGNVLWGGRPYDGEFDGRKLCVKNICHQSIFYGRDIFRLCGKYSLSYKLWADWEMNLRCFGRRRIVKQHLPITIAHFEEGGLSAKGDREFEQNKWSLVRRHFGFCPYWYAKWPFLRSHLKWRAKQFVSRFKREPLERGERIN